MNSDSKYPRSDTRRTASPLRDSQVLSLDRDTSDWPQGLVDVADVIGPELTLRLVDRFGGVEGYYVPKLATSAAKNHPWAPIIGDEAWRRLCKAFGGQRINLPRGQFLELKKKTIIELAETTELSHRAIALQARVTETYVRIVLRQTQCTSQRQLDLFPKKIRP